MAGGSRFWVMMVCLWAVAVALGGMIYSTMQAADNFTADPATGHARFGLLGGPLDGFEAFRIQVADVSLVHENGTRLALGEGVEVDLVAPSGGHWTSVGNATVPAGNYTGLRLTFNHGVAEPTGELGAWLPVRAPEPLSVSHAFRVAPGGNLTLVLDLQPRIDTISGGALAWRPVPGAPIESPEGGADWSDAVPVRSALTR